MVKQSINTDAIVEKLHPLFLRMMAGENVKRSEEESTPCRQLFSRNVLFLRTYLGFITKGAPHDQLEFASIIGISPPGLRRWEGAEVIPNELSLRALSKYANEVLKTPIPIQNAHLLYRNLINELSLLRMGSHSSEFQNLSTETQRQFASFVNNNMDQVLNYFMQETHESKINFKQKIGYFSY